MCAKRQGLRSQCKDLGRRQFLAAAAGMIGFIVSACQGTRPERRPVPTYNVEITGSSDTTFTGTISVDGAVRNVSGKGKENWSFQCDELVCWFRQGPEPGLLRFELRNGTSGARSVSVPGPGGECRLIGRKGKTEARTTMKPIEPAPAQRR
ncbi:MAG: hypothetical protein AB9869_11865 [Verrucomicrobiia bacterium]